MRLVTTRRPGSRRVSWTGEPSAEQDFGRGLASSAEQTEIAGDGHQGVSQFATVVVPVVHRITRQWSAVVFFENLNN